MAGKGIEMYRMTFAEAVAKADALKQLSSGPVYLENGEGAWPHATRVEPGSTHRLEMSTSVYFIGTIPGSAVEVRWNFDIEPFSANGTGSYQIDKDECRRVMGLLPEKVRAQFREYLLECAEKVAKKGLEYQSVADKQMLDAKTLRDIAAT